MRGPDILPALYRPGLGTYSTGTKGAPPVCGVETRYALQTRRTRKKQPLRTTTPFLAVLHLTIYLLFDNG